MERESLLNSRNDGEIENCHRSYNLEEFSKKELIEKCNKFLAIAKTAKQSKDKALRENEMMKQELKELRGSQFDLELENQILKREKSDDKFEDVSLLSELPTIRNPSEDSDQRSNCFWRLSKFFKGKS